MLRQVFVIVVAIGLVASSATIASAARTKQPVTCRRGHFHHIVADTRAEIFEAEEPSGSGWLGLWGCVYGRRAYFLGPLSSLTESVPRAPQHLALAGSMVAYEEHIFEERSRYEEDLDEGPVRVNEKREWYVVIRDLGSGRLIHRVPTGIPTRPKVGLVGIGGVFSLLVKNDGSAAWIAEDAGDVEGVGTLSEKHVFDVEEVDKTGARLLASGTDIDPASLALSLAGANILGELAAHQGNKLYWIQGGQAFTTLLN